MNNVRVLSWVLIVAKWGLQPGRQHLRELWETAPEKQEVGQYICDFGDVGIHADKHIFLPEGFC